jgi:RNA polymerase sigma factor (sigma-70 family)
VRRARDGDLDAYEVLVARYGAVAHRTAVLLGAGADAEDVVQDSFVKAFGGLHRFRDGAPFRPWLLRIVVNQTKNANRGRRRRQQLELRAVDAEPAVDPEQQALDGLRREALLAAVRELPAKDQLVVTCRYFLDLGEEETARVLGWPRGSVKSRTSRALARLRARMGQEVTGG